MTDAIDPKLKLVVSAMLERQCSAGEAFQDGLWRSSIGPGALAIAQLIARFGHEIEPDEFETLLMVGAGLLIAKRQVALEIS